MSLNRLNEIHRDEVVQASGRGVVLRQLDLTVVDMVCGADMRTIRTNHVRVFFDLRCIDHQFHSLL